MEHFGIDVGHSIKVKDLLKENLCFELVDLKLTDYLLQKRRKKRGAAFIPNLYRSTLTLAFA